MIALIFRALSLLPLRALHALGGALGWVVYWASPTYRRHLRTNLPPTLANRQRVLHQAIAESGKQAVELAWVWTRTGEQIRARTRIENAQALQAILAQDRAILMLTPHLGCFEVIAQNHASSPIGRTRPMLALYRVPRKAALRPLFEQARTHKGLLLAPADLHGVRLMLRALRNRQIVGLLPDQVPSQGEGVWAPFFGRPAFTMTLPARLARAHDALVLLLYAQRLPHGAGYRIQWEPLSEPLSGNAVLDATRINRAMERLILQCPEQYLWSYNRYKVPAGVPAPVAQAES
ncbi:MAG TPA: lysophospholipid acyltransferase family protein [Burkholderiaceae bacterium]|nr:lysophospholipid acyltransferase family protein [Burkholderiaceae bacterium]